MSVPNLAFEALDRQVVNGLADEPALLAESVTLTFAQLLHESSSLASGLRQLGLSGGEPVSLMVPQRRIHVVSVLAIARLGAELESDLPGARYRILEDPAKVYFDAEVFDYDVVLRAGRTDPQPARINDSTDYAERLESLFGDIFDTLRAGKPLT